MIHIEKPLAEEAQLISDVHRQSWHETYDGILPREKIEEMLSQSEPTQIWHFQEVANGNRPEHFLLVAKNEKKEIIGFSDIRFDGEYAEIKAIYIIREYQRKSIGSEMMKKSFLWLKKPVQTGVDIVVENRPAIHFFEKHGFTSTGNMESIGGINIVSLLLINQSTT